MQEKPPSPFQTPDILIIPAADTKAPPRKKNSPETAKNGTQTSIHDPSEKDTNFEQISHRLCGIFRSKLEMIKNTKRSKTPDFLCGISCAALGCIGGAALSDVSPLSSGYNFAEYVIAAILAVGCGVAYFCFESKSELNTQEIANELLGYLPSLETTPPEQNETSNK